MKKNIWPAIFDIRPKSDRPRKIERVLDLTLPPRTRPHSSALIDAQLERRSDSAKRLVIPAAMLGIFLTATWLGVRVGQSYVLSKKDEVMAGASAVLAEMELGGSALKELQFARARQHFLEAQNQIDATKSRLGMIYGLLTREPSWETLPLRAAAISAEFEGLGAALKATIFSGAKAGDVLGRIENDLKSFAADIRKLPVFSDQALTAKIISSGNELNEVLAGIEGLKNILALDGEKSYLLLFQNPAEIRATGGFIGSYGIVRLHNGEIADFSVDDIVNLDGKLKIKVLPPRPLLRLTSGWTVHDANWFFDFRDSARKIAWFFDRAQGVEVDGVIAVNPQAVAAILGVAGPVDLPEYNETITSENLWKELQIQARIGQDRAKGQPKAFLGVFGKRLFEKIREIPAEEWPEVAGVLRGALARKEIQLYFSNPEIQALVESHGWAGRVLDSAGMDYLAVVHTNIGGGKADYVTRQEVELKTLIEYDGGIVNTVTIRRFHEGDKETYPWWRAKNYDYVRVYVPRGAQLISASGAQPEPKLLTPDREIYRIDPDLGLLANPKRPEVKPSSNLDIFEESGKTVFAGWLTVNPGGIAALEIKYRLPISAGYASPGYALMFQPQSGIGQQLKHLIELPEGAEITAQSGGFDGSKSRWLTESVQANLIQSLQFKFPPPR